MMKIIREWKKEIRGGERSRMRDWDVVRLIHINYAHLNRAN